MKKFVEESWLVIVMGVVFAGMLAGTQVALKPAIDGNKAAFLENAVDEVIGASATKEEINVEKKYDVAPYKSRTVFICRDEQGETVGYAVVAKGVGFVDTIELVIGYSADGQSITGVKVIDNKETPGLGNKIEGEDFAGQYKKLRPGAKLVVTKQTPKEGANEVQAITAATYSSEYTTGIINYVNEHVRPHLGELAGAAPEAE